MPLINSNTLHENAMALFRDLDPRTLSQLFKKENQAQGLSTLQKPVDTEQLKQQAVSTALDLNPVSKVAGALAGVIGTRGAKNLPVNNLEYVPAGPEGRTVPVFDIPEAGIQDLDFPTKGIVRKRLGELVNWPQLYDHYPQFRDMPTTFTRGGPGWKGTYTPDDRGLSLTANSLIGARQGLAHELTHAAEDVGSIPRGGNTQEALAMLRALEKNHQNPGEFKPLYAQISNALRKGLTSKELANRDELFPDFIYKALHGEALARAGQRRAGYDPELLKLITINKSLRYEASKLGLEPEDLITLYNNKAYPWEVSHVETK